MPTEQAVKQLIPRPTRPPSGVPLSDVCVLMSQRPSVLPQLQSNSVLKTAFCNVARFGVDKDNATLLFQRPDTQRRAFRAASFCLALPLSLSPPYLGFVAPSCLHYLPSGSGLRAEQEQSPGFLSSRKGTPLRNREQASFSLGKAVCKGKTKPAAANEQGKRAILWWWWGIYMAAT